MVSNNSYITLEAFMVNELQLKGNELLVYAIIYGFTQSKGNYYTGTLSFLEGWCNVSKQTVINTIKALMEKSLIAKKTVVVDGKELTGYYTVLDDTVEVEPEKPKEDKDSIYNDSIVNIIDYLNMVTHSRYKYSNKSTRKHIVARLKEGYTEQDFSTVILKKADEWMGTNMQRYLTPDTLFSTKFEKYLNQNNSVKKTTNTNSVDWNAIALSQKH